MEDQLWYVGRRLNRWLIRARARGLVHCVRGNVVELFGAFPPFIAESPGSMLLQFGYCAVPSRGNCRSATKQPAASMLVAGLLVATSLLGATGCGSSEPVGPQLVQVSGTVKMNGKPLTTGGTVSYRDASGLIQPTGKVDPAGHYQLFTDKRSGAPAGKYRVLVFASESPEQTAAHGGLPRLIVHKQYMDPTATPLNVEVKEGNPSSAYDLQVTGVN